MQIKNYQNLVLDYLRRWNDVRSVGQAVFVVVVLLISWSGIKAIQTNYGLQKQITALKEQNDLQSLENSNLALDNNYYESNQYLELAARQNFGLAAPGEKEIVVPQSVAMSYTVDLPTDKTTDSQSKAPSYQQNFQSWVDFFLHRQGGN